MAAIAGWMTLRFSSGVARVALRIIFLGLLLLFFSRSRWLPDVAGIGVLLSLAVAAGAVVAIRRCLG
jgi:glycopeptide antibiotics resistance protein